MGRHPQPCRGRAPAGDGRRATGRWSTIRGAEKAAVGIADDHARGEAGRRRGWVSVAIAPGEPLPRPVTLAAMKAEPALAGMAMLRQSRLSVSPVSEAEWDAIMALAE